MRRKIVFVLDESLSGEGLYRRVNRFFALRLLRKAIGTFRADSVIVVNAPSRPEDDGDGERVRYEDVGNYVPDAIARLKPELVRQSISIAQTWYRDNDAKCERDVSSASIGRGRALSLGRMYEHDLATDIYDVLLKREYYREVLKREGPREVLHYCDGLTSRVLTEVSREMGVAARDVRPFLLCATNAVLKFLSVVHRVSKDAADFASNLRKERRTARRDDGLHSPKRPVVMLFSTLNTSKILRPVYNRLMENGTGAVAVHHDYSSSFRVKAKLIENGIGFVGYARRGIYFDVLESLSVYLKQLLRRARANRLTQLSRDGERLFPSRGISDLIDYYAFQKSYRMMLFARTVSRLLDELNPAILVTANSKNWDGRIFVELGNSRGCETLSVQEGLYGVPPEFHVLFNSNKIALYGDGFRDEFLEWGVDERRLLVTGSPVYDAYAERKNDNGEVPGAKTWVHDMFKIASDREIILFASQPTDGDYRGREKHEILSGLLRSMRELNDCCLVFKLHPYEDDFSIRSALRDYGGNNVVVVRDLDIFELIRISDLVVTRHSTTAMEAVIFDKPVITINLSGTPDPFPYAESRVSLGIYRSEDILPGIRAMLSDDRPDERRSHYEAFLKKYLDRLDGRSTDRIVDYIRGVRAGRTNGVDDTRTIGVR